MKLYFAGTSHGVPEKDRACTSTLVEVGGKYYAFDAGSPLVDAMRRWDAHPNDLAAIFITHVHSDHVAGLPGATDLFTWCYKESDPIIHTPEQRLLDGLLAWNTMLYGDRARHFRSVVFEEGVIYDDGTLRVTAVRTQHVAYSYAFVLEAEGKRVLISGDLKHPALDFPAPCFTDSFDAIITECAHFNADVYAPVFDRCLCKRFFLNHVAPARLSGLEVLTAPEKPYTVKVLSDGEVLELA